MAGARRGRSAPFADVRRHRVEPLRTHARIGVILNALKEKHLKEALSFHRRARGMRQRVGATRTTATAPALPARRQNGGKNFSHPATLFASGFA
jgi:hypothetical protein